MFQYRHSGLNVPFAPITVPILYTIRSFSLRFEACTVPLIGALLLVLLLVRGSFQEDPEASSYKLGLLSLTLRHLEKNDSLLPHILCLYLIHIRLPRTRSKGQEKLSSFFQTWKF